MDEINDLSLSRRCQLKEFARPWILTTDGENKKWRAQSRQPTTESTLVLCALWARVKVYPLLNIIL